MTSKDTDQRLPRRIQEVRLRFIQTNTLVTLDNVRDELCRLYDEYKKMKKGAMKQFILQELSNPPPERPKEGDDNSDDDEDDAGGSKKKKRKRDKKKANPYDIQQHPEESADANNVNSALRKMYNPEAKPVTPPPQPPAKKQRAGGGMMGGAGATRAMRQQARKELGLGEPEGSAFQPEDRPEERLEDLGGIDGILADLRQCIVQPLGHPEVFTHLGVHPPTGVLLHGPPGSGKTKLAHAIAGSTGVNFFKVAATEVVSGMSGESESKIRQLFKAAMDAAPSLLFLDEIDAITPKRDSAGREMERRIVAQMLTCMDDLRKTNVMVLGATNRPDALDPALRRAGRFDREIAMGIPDEAARARILEKMAQGMRLAEDLDLPLLARLTPGFVGADLSSLTKEAALSAVSRAFADLDRQKQEEREDDDDKPEPYTAEELAGLWVEMKDFHSALTRVQPSARREGFTTIPDVRWEDIGALQEVREDLDAAVCEPIRKAALFKQLGLTVPVGVLLFGPPGCGKTLLAKAVANASGANFIAIKGPELLNKYVGESERAVRLVFQRAMSSSPCVIFFDELDALVPRRSAEGSTSAERVVNQMLTEMDGVNERSQVYVIAATNRPDIVDPAMLRPGRLDRLLFVPLPSAQGRLEILQAHMRKVPLADDVDLKVLAQQTDGFSGADLASLAREAAMMAIREAKMPDRDASQGPAADEKAAEEAAASIRINAALMARARGRVHASVGKEERREYEAMAMKMCNWTAGRAAAAAAAGAASAPPDGAGVAGLPPPKSASA